MNLNMALFRKRNDRYWYWYLKSKVLSLNHIFSHTDLFSIKDLIATKLINVPGEIRKYWWENSENLINVPGTTISDSRVVKKPWSCMIFPFFSGLVDGNVAMEDILTMLNTVVKESGIEDLSSVVNLEQLTTSPISTGTIHKLR